MNTLKYAFRITHIDNIPHILKFGLLRPNSPNCDEKYVNIGDSQIINIRKNKRFAGINLSECVPFYFGPRSPMLYVVQHGYKGVTMRHPREIVYCVLSLKGLFESGTECIFTDGHALSSLTRFFGRESLPYIDRIIKYEDVYASQWNIETDIDLKRRKEAELLVKEDLPPDSIIGYVVYDSQAKEELKLFGIEDKKVVIYPNYYF
ncbi:MAG: DUF4433 domain-containing protein [Clostridium sp.]|nr:DUF4433 domain-containing protein [Clostridium sp.]